jgi:hypothetical protein
MVKRNSSQVTFWMQEKWDENQQAALLRYALFWIMPPCCLAGSNLCPVRVWAYRMYEADVT